MFQQPQQPNDGLDVRGAVNWGYLLIDGLVTCFTPFLRWGFGGEAFGFNALAAVAIMFLYLMAYPRSPGMLGFICLWVLALICQRMIYFVRRWRGIYEHSHYGGTPWIGLVFPFLERTGISRVLEIAACLYFSGNLCRGGDLALGRFFAFGAGALLLKWRAESWLESRHVARMNDAALEQRSRLARWRRGNY